MKKKKKAHVLLVMDPSSLPILLHTFLLFLLIAVFFVFFVLRTYANETMYIVWVFVQNNCKPLSSHGRRIQKEINENGLLHWFKTQISVRFDSFEPTHGFQLYSCAF